MLQSYFKIKNKNQIPRIYYEHNNFFLTNENRNITHIIIFTVMYLLYNLQHSYPYLVLIIDHLYSLFIPSFNVPTLIFGMHFNMLLQTIIRCHGVSSKAVDDEFRTAIFFNFFFFIHYIYHNRQIIFDIRVDIYYLTVSVSSVETF